MTPQGSPVVEATAWFSVWGSSNNVREVVKYAEVIGRGRGRGYPVAGQCSVSVVAVQLCRSSPAYSIQMRGTQGPKSNPHGSPGRHPWKGLYIRQERGTSLSLCPEALCGRAGQTSQHEGLCSRFS